MGQKLRAVAPVWIFLVVSCALLAGCGKGGTVTGTVTDFEFVNARMGSTGSPEIAVDEPLELRVSGTGKCDTVKITFGTDLGGGGGELFALVSSADFSRPVIENSFAYPARVWRGRRKVTVAGVDTSGIQNALPCHGTVTKNIYVTGVGPTFLSFGRYGVNIRPNNACASGTAATPVPLPRLRKDTEVRINVDAPNPADPTPRVDEMRVGTGSGAAFYDADGDGFVASPSFAFPGRVRFSVVYRVGRLEVQGKKGVVFFRTNELSPLEFCFNEDATLLNGNGGFLFEVAIDESNVVP